MKRPNSTEALRQEFQLHEYIWPRLCGAERRRWEQAAQFVDRAAREHHRHHCHGTMADGQTRQQVPSFAGRHADDHRSAVTLGFVVFADAGIPRWMTDRP